MMITLTFLSTFLLQASSNPYTQLADIDLGVDPLAWTILESKFQTDGNSMYMYTLVIDKINLDKVGLYKYDVTNLPVQMASQMLYFSNPIDKPELIIINTTVILTYKFSANGLSYFTSLSKVDLTVIMSDANNGMIHGVYFSQHDFIAFND